MEEREILRRATGFGSRKKRRVGAKRVNRKRTWRVQADDLRTFLARSPCRARTCTLRSRDGPPDTEKCQNKLVRSERSRKEQLEADLANAWTRDPHGAFAEWGIPEAHGKRRSNNSFIFNKEDWCPGWESNPHEEKSPEDFKSSASAIPPPGQWYLQSNESSPSPQQHGWPGGLRKDSGDLLAGCDSFVSSSRIGRRRKVSKLSGDADSVFPPLERESASSSSSRSVCDNFCQLRDGKRHHRATATHATAHNRMKVR